MQAPDSIERHLEVVEIFEGTAVERGSCVLEIPGAPPSINKTSSGFSKGALWKWRRAKIQWESEIYYALIAAEVPKGITEVRVSGRIDFPKDRRRDEGNYRAILEKAFGDALTMEPRPWTKDDTPAEFSFLSLGFGKYKHPRTVLYVSWVAEDAT